VLVIIRLVNRNLGQDDYGPIYPGNLYVFEQAVYIVDRMKQGHTGGGGGVSGHTGKTR
jgi:hypothetical protein